MTRMRVVLCCITLAVLTGVAFSGVARNDFVLFDDDRYVTDNQIVQKGLSRDGLAWAFTTGYTGNWHPLAWLSHMLDVELFGMSATGPHLVNLFIHIANALLLFLLFTRMTKALWPSAFLAALFAVHPLHVESVAWVSERKDVLSTLFWFLALHAYVSYVGRRGAFRYALVFLFFCLGLMTKPMLVTAPCTLLLLDLWPLNRVATASETAARVWRGLIVEKLPLFGVSAVFSFVTLFVQQVGKNTIAFDLVPLSTRIGAAFISYAAYLGKTVWPFNLAVFYPHAGDGISWWGVGLASTLFVFVTIAACLTWRTRPYLAMGWLWYVITLAPVIGIVQVGGQAMADRYTYVPLIGVFVCAAWGLSDLLRNRDLAGRALAAAAVVVVVALSSLTWIQTRHWRDTETLFRHALAVTNRNAVAHVGLANALSAEGRLEEAVEHYGAGLSLQPIFPEAYVNLGVIRAMRGDLNGAKSLFVRALQIDPEYGDAQFNYANVLLREGKREEAAVEFRKALEMLAPTHEMYRQAERAVQHLEGGAGAPGQSVETPRRP